MNGGFARVEQASDFRRARLKAPVLTTTLHALENIDEHLSAIKDRLGMLSERLSRALPSKPSAQACEDEALWRGIADENTRQQAIRAAHRAGRGEWYAVLEVARAHSTYPYLWEVVAIEHAKCATRGKTAEAGKAL